MTTLFYCFGNLIFMGIVLVAFYKRVLPENSRRLYLFSLALKLAGTVVLAYLFMYGFDYTTDPQSVFSESVKTTQLFVHHPGRFGEIYFGPSIPELSYDSLPRTYFLIKIVSVLNLATGGNYWLDSLWLSLFCFLAIWQLLLTIKKHCPSLFLPFTAALLFVPSTIFWPSGLMKETIALGSLCMLVASFVAVVSGQSFWKHLALCLIPAYMLFQLKFYVLGAFLLVTTPAFLVLTVTLFWPVEKPIKALLYFITFGIVLLVSNAICTQLFSVGITDLIFYNHEAMGFTHRVDFFFPGLKEFDSASFLPYLPEALWQGLFMPLPWNATHFLMHLEAVLNFLTLCMVAYSLFSFLRKPRLFSDGMALLVLYVTICAIALACSTPNWGTLARYKVVYMPFLHAVLFLHLSEKEWVKRIFAPFGRFRLF